MRACVRARVCVCVCVRAGVCVHACVCARAWMHACSSEHYSCVCGCMSVEEAGAGEWGERNVRVRFLRIYFIFIVILLYLQEPMCQRNIFIFMLCILMNNKD